MKTYEDIRKIIENTEGLLDKHEETKLLFDLASSVKGKNIIEIGSHKGLSSICLGYGALNSGGTVFCIDVWGNFDYYNIWLNVMRQNKLSNVSIRCNANTALKQLQIKNAGLVFIDSGHSYEDCKLQFENILDNLDSGCIVAYHDYGHRNYPGVKQYCDEITESGLLQKTQLVLGTYYGFLNKS